MALRFNVPPNWPKPPEGWTPQPGWQPDPAWGPAPEGWKFWVDDSETPADETLSSSSSANDSTDADDHTKVIDYSQNSSEYSSAETPDQAGQYQPGQFSNQQEGNYQQAGNYQTAGAPVGASSYQAGNYNQQSANNYQPGHAPYQNGSNPYQNNQPKKKNFFATTAGILTIIGVVLLALLVGVIWFVASAISSVNEVADNATPSSSASSFAPSAGSASETAEASSSSAPLGAGIPGEEKDGVQVYTGSGDEILDVTKPGNADDPAWIEFEFTPDSSDTYPTFYMDGYDKSGERTDIFETFGGEEIGDKLKSSLWMDSSATYEKTTKLSIEAKGDWIVRIHKASDAPVYKDDDVIKGNTSAAFVYDGDASKVNIKYTSKASGGYFSLDAYDKEYGSFMPLESASGEEYEGTTSAELSGTTPVKVEAPVGSEWEISFKK